MRRLSTVLLSLLLLFCLAVPAWASGASDVRVDADLEDDGSCEVTISATIHPDSSDDLAFPIPASARSVSLNGAGAFTQKRGQFQYVDLSDENDGRSFTITIRYTVPGAVSYTEEGYPVVELYLLCGFSYPISDLAFSLTLPDDVEYAPTFSSGYHQQSIEENVDYTCDGRQVLGTVKSTLKDHETLTMSLRVSEKTFPRSMVEPWTAGFADIAMFVFMGLAFLYWIIFLRCAPHLRRPCNQPPEGVTAGELRCVLTGQGADLTTMVMTWAQLGYILIHLQENDRVILYKRMEMGNERGSFENKVFRNLFGKKRTVDGSGYHYARLYRKVAASRGSLQDLFRRDSGNPKVFRLLAAAAGVFGGASLAVSLAGNALLGFLVIALMSVVGGGAAWLMQNWVQGLHLRSKGSLALGLLLGAVWILLGTMAGQSGMAIGLVAFQLAVGLAGAYGGRRTVSGRQATSQILGLRAWLKKLPEEDLDRICRTDPDFFFTMIPYALALGIDRPFARQFGRKRMNPCTWLTTGMDGHMTALEWRSEMRRALDSLDEHQKRLPLEQLMGK